jgi:alcohol dehydrogenase class IV
MALGIATLTDTRDHLHEIETLHRLFVEKGYDSIMALGTGPVVQIAKILNLTVCLGPEILRSSAGPQQIKRPLPPHITASTAMDALSHAIEACLCLARNPLSTAHAHEAIDQVRQMNQDLHHATAGAHAVCFKDIMDRNGQAQVPRHRLSDIAQNALGDGSIFYNPEDLDYDDCLMVLEAAHGGTPLDRSRVKTRITAPFLYKNY